MASVDDTLPGRRYATPGAGVELARWQRWQGLAARLREQCTTCSGTSTTSTSDAPSTGLARWFSWSKPDSSSIGASGATSPGSASRWSSWSWSRPTAAAAQPPPPRPTAPHSGPNEAASMHFDRAAAMTPGTEITRRFMASHPISLQVLMDGFG